MADLATKIVKSTEKMDKHAAPDEDPRRRSTQRGKATFVDILFLLMIHSTIGRKTSASEVDPDALSTLSLFYSPDAINDAKSQLYPDSLVVEIAMIPLSRPGGPGPFGWISIAVKRTAELVPLDAPKDIKVCPTASDCHWESQE